MNRKKVNSAAAFSFIQTFFVLINQKMSGNVF